MKKMFALLVLAAVASVSGAYASELDNEKNITNAQRYAADLPQTVVVRKGDDGSVAVFQSMEKLGKDARIDDSKFVKTDMKATNRGELDGDSSTSGWYFYWYSWGFNYYPSYYYYGYNYYYQPYYSYYYNNYWYYGYQWNYWWY